MAIERILYKVKNQFVTEREYEQLVPHQSKEYKDSMVSLFRDHFDNDDNPFTITFLDTGGVHLDPPSSEV